ncbi:MULTISPECIES: hypothetical protein [unclassified Streptomyces]|uniref:hypothetical protein n=1 Tax=unclassified Streptomyces TaxID=2593676 RepID=UPI0035D5E9D5
MRPEPEPQPSDPIPGIYSWLVDHDTQIRSIKKDIAPLTLKEFPWPWETWKQVSASYQTLYSSVQAFKVDLEAIAVTGTAFKVDESGVYLMGAKVYEFPWVSALEGKFGTASASAKELGALEERVASMERSRPPASEGADQNRGSARELNELSDKVSALKRTQDAYKQKKVGDANRWATRKWVDNRLKTAKSVRDRIANSPEVTQASQDIQQLTRRVSDLEATLGK